MPDYSLSKIYRLWIGDLVYIGSTAQPRLSMRLGQHKSCYTQWVKTGKKYMSSYELFKVGMPIIELIEIYPCKSKDELHAREGYYIRETDCVNKRSAGQTPEEYREANQAKLCEYHKGYREANKDKICDQKKGYYEANKAIICEHMKGYREANKAIILEKQRLRRESMKRVECLTLFIHSHLQKVVV